MIECSGKTFFSSADAVTGRLWRIGKGDGVSSDMAKILLWDGSAELSDALLRTAVGVVFPMGISDDELKRASRLAEFRRLPAIRINCGLDGILGDACEKIAILDSERKKLYINPDLETINSFFGVKARKPPKNISVLSEYSDAPLPDGFDGLIVGKALPTLAGEDEAYEYFCDIADKNMGLSIVATADLGSDDEHGDSFISRVRAIYRAGVWGRFSLLCTSVNTPDRADTCISLMHKAFCGLDSEGREFNGFIPKGIAISTPLMLLSRPKHRIIDFFCMDFARLRRLMTDSRDIQTGDVATAEYISAFAREAATSKITLRSGGALTPEALRRLTADDTVSQIYATPNELRKVRQWV
ncbi:MAG: hypothetical protein IJY08_00470 [Clostridia bacterium]|nr:hypothetical protein [Clostridia bacterium]